MNDGNRRSDVEREREHADRLGNRNGDPQRGGRLPTAESEAGDEPRPADEDAKSAIPSRSFNL